MLTSMIGSKINDFIASFKLFPTLRLPEIGKLLLGPGIAFAGFYVVKGGVDNFVCYGFVMREFAGK